MNYRKDKRKFLSLEKDERYAHLSKETWEAIATMTGRSFFEENMETYKSQNENQREEYDMCQALREIREDFFNEGKLSAADSLAAALKGDTTASEKPSVNMEELKKQYPLLSMLHKK